MKEGIISPLFQKKKFMLHKNTQIAKAKKRNKTWSNILLIYSGEI